MMFYNNTLYNLFFFLFFAVSVIVTGAPILLCEIHASGSAVVFGSFEARDRFIPYVIKPLFFFFPVSVILVDSPILYNYYLYTSLFFFFAVSVIATGAPLFFAECEIHASGSAFVFGPFEAPVECGPIDPFNCREEISTVSLPNPESVVPPFLTADFIRYMSRGLICSMYLRCTKYHINARHEV